MSKINQIQQAIQELEGGAFQKLAESYLYKKGYQQINSIGSMLGNNKVRKGTPDSLVCMPDGRYVFGEHTTTPKERLFSKFQSDISKCFDEDKTGIEVTDIDEIVLCHTSTLSTKEVNALRKMCSKKGVNINIFGCSDISYDLLEKYPAISKDHLNIEIDTGQVIELDKFLSLYERNKFSTSLQTEFCCRENDKQSVLTLMDTCDMVVLTGAAGVGKSRLAVECYREFYEGNNSYKAYCIFNKGIDIFEDLKCYFSDSGNYLILVDDANRISGFSYILQLLRERREDQSFKVVVTVRDYASDKLIQSAKEFTTLEEVALNKFDDNEIKSLLSEALDIKNSRYQERILEIAEGNPRLAIMAGKIAVDKQFIESINDVSGIYNAYFSSIKNDLEALSSGVLLKVAGIVSFLRYVDKSNSEQMGEIEANFGIGPFEFWQCVNQLHQMEIFDIYENEVVKLSDQVLATYIFYLVFIKDNHLEFGLLLAGFFPKYRKKIVDAINPVFNAFDFTTVKKSISAPIDRSWSELRARDEASFLQFIDCFWFVKPTDTLLFVKGEIDLNYIERDCVFDDSLWDTEQRDLPAPFNILPRFKFFQEEEFRLALGLLLQYAEAQPEMSGRIVYCFTNDFGFESESYNYYYRVQQLVSDELIDKSAGGKNLYFSKLFIAVAENYLQTHFSCTRAARNNAIAMYDFDLVESDELTSLRRSLLYHLTKLAQIKKLRETVLELFFKYAQNRPDLNSASIIDKDFELIQPFIIDNLDPQKLYHCEIVQSYVKHLKRLNISCTDKLEEMFSCTAYKLYEELFKENSQAELRLGYEKYIEYRVNKVKKFLVGFVLDDYIALFEELYVLMSKSEGGRNDWLLEQGFIALFEGLSETNANLFKSVVAEYLKFSDEYKVSPYKIVLYLLNSLSRQQVYSLIFSHEYKTRLSWVGAFYIHLSADQIKSDDLKSLIELYSKAPACAFYYNLEYLLKYNKLQQGFIRKVVSIIVERSIEERNLGSILRCVFSEHLESDKEIKALVSVDTELLKKTYIRASVADRLFDYDGSEFNKLLDLSPEFMTHYLSESKHEDNNYSEGRDYTFIWFREDYSIVMKQVDKHFLDDEKLYGIYREYQCFYQRLSKPQQDKTVIEKQDNYLKSIIEFHNKNEKYMDMIFQLVQEFESDRKPQFYGAFLDSNKCLEDFKSLRFEKFSMSWSGSMIPLLDARVKFYEQIKALCSSVDLLEHRSYMDSLIEGERKHIAYQKKQEYMDDF